MQRLGLIFLCRHGVAKEGGYALSHQALTAFICPPMAWRLKAGTCPGARPWGPGSPGETWTEAASDERDLVRGVAARMRSGVLADVPFAENPRLVEAWTRQEQP